MKEIIYRSIGIIHSPFKDMRGMPIQPVAAARVCGTVEIGNEYENGLKDLEGFSHVILPYHFHQSDGYSLEVKPFLDDHPHGVFCTRAPRRPNPIGLSVVKLVKIDKNVIHIENVDILDGTPLLDIKPYIPDFDAVSEVRKGWHGGKEDKARGTSSDDRFK